MIWPHKMQQPSKKNYTFKIWLGCIQGGGKTGRRWIKDVKETVNIGDWSAIEGLSDGL
jgi:hypothetical protein